MYVLEDSKSKSKYSVTSSCIVEDMENVSNV